MRFWDSSALVPLILAEALSAVVMRISVEDPGMAVWWGTEVECVSALVREERARPAAVGSAAFQRLAHLAGGWTVMDPGERIKTTAIRMLRVHALRAADALQLAAAEAVARRQAGRLGFVCLDERLREAARKEGFAVLPE